jgi:sec-independent protein translocase protein TatA
MFGLSPQELFIVFLIILLLFGGKKIPEIARALGKAMREFRQGVDDIKEDISRSAEEPSEPAAPAEVPAAPATAAGTASAAEDEADKS